ncbi:hypothetical protein LJC39_03310 [Parabacteroides sp. OttesenSCG-928-B22]|nr:hypothetical protein [Parabacteroides sp. OttesenSCG-928-B22]
MAMTILQSLKSINAYPVPLCAIQDIAETRGLDVESDASLEIRAQASFRLAKADVLLWLSKAPNISQAGISYNFTDADRLNFRRQASAIYQDCGESLPGSSYGYKGERL